MHEYCKNPGHSLQISVTKSIRIRRLKRENEMDTKCSDDRNLQESCAIARKPRDAAAVRCGLNFADIHYILRVTKFHKPGFRAIDIPAQNRI